MGCLEQMRTANEHISECSKSEYSFNGRSTLMCYYVVLQRKGGGEKGTETQHY